MELHYLCPKCRSYLRVKENIILSFKVKESNKQGIILLNPKLGDYTFIVHSSINFEKGELVEFFCPICSENLKTTEINEKLVHIIMVDKDIEYDIYFSSIAGEQITFKIEKNNIIENFGSDASTYLNYFSAKLEQQLNK